MKRSGTVSGGGFEFHGLDVPGLSGRAVQPAGFKGSGRAGGMLRRAMAGAPAALPRGARAPAPAGPAQAPGCPAARPRWRGGWCRPQPRSPGRALDLTPRCTGWQVPGGPVLATWLQAGRWDLCATRPRHGPSVRTRGLRGAPSAVGGCKVGRAPASPWTPGRGRGGALGRAAGDRKDGAGQPHSALGTTRPSWKWSHSGARASSGPG